MMGFTLEHGGVVYTTPPLLEMRNVSKSFGSLIANNDVSISLRHGEILGLLGENGAGKSTLMKMLYGLYSMDQGKIYIDGKEVKISSPQEAVRLGVGMVHQEFMQVPTITVAENVMLGAEPGNFLHYDTIKAAEKVSELARKFGLIVDPNKKVADLSVGQRQRVEILKALYRDARILILDEPTAVLTPQEVEELFKVLRVFVEEGLSIVFITHKLGEVLKVCDRITILRDGRAIDTVDAKTTSKAQLAKMMVGREVVLRVQRSDRAPGEAVLTTKDLSFDSAFAQIPLKDINLSVRAGEIVGIAGVDGNGQKELGEVLAGIRVPTKGKIILLKDDITYLGPKERYDRGISFVPEDRKHTGLVGAMNISENIALRKYGSPPISKHGFLNPKVMDQYASKLVNEFDVRPRRIDNEAQRLSGGNQQKVILARELSVEPTVIIASQPTRGLDVGAIEFVHNLLMQERSRGAAIILISFELDEIRSLADRIIVLYHGSVIGEVNNLDATDEMIGLWMAGIK
ncbi:MAG: ABC transporter ATP-binding protein [Anaerolineaceae bacterium]